MAVTVSRTTLVAGGLLVAAVLAAGAGGWSNGRGAPSAASPPVAESPAKPAAAPEKAADRRDHWLRAYEQRRRNMRSLHAVVQHTRHDPLFFGQKTILDEEVFLKRPGLLRVDQKERANGKDKYQRIVVLTTKEMRLFNFEQRIEWVIDTSPPVPKAGVEWLEGALFKAEDKWTRAIYGGLSAKELRSRFDLRLTKEDDNWVYIEGRPRTKEDESWFTRGQMVLSARTHLVRRIWLESPNRNQDSWDFLKVEVDPSITAETFNPPLPKGWTREVASPHDDRSPR